MIVNGYGALSTTPLSLTMSSEVSVPVLSKQQTSTCQEGRRTGDRQEEEGGGGDTENAVLEQSQIVTHNNVTARLSAKVRHIATDASQAL